MVCAVYRDEPINLNLSNNQIKIKIVCSYESYE
jgi:hypothetical protein